MFQQFVSGIIVHGSIGQKAFEPLIGEISLTITKKVDPSKATEKFSGLPKMHI